MGLLFVVPDINLHFNERNQWHVSQLTLANQSTGTFQMQ